MSLFEALYGWSCNTPISWSDPVNKVSMLENYIYKEMEHINYYINITMEKCIKQERHIYTWFTEFGLRPQRNNQSFLLYYP